MNDEFYIGWEMKAAPGIGRSARKAVVALVGLVVLIATILAVSQRLIGQSVFEWGTRKTFSGVLQIEPYPHLLVPRPGKIGAGPQFSTYYLVAPWKFGLDREALAPLAGKPVTLEGTLIYRGEQTMVETKPEWIQADPKPLGMLPAEVRPLGTRTFVGEIVDSKCFFGVMNPGQLIPHRACAIRCISGGVPPILLVRQKNGSAIYLLLVSMDRKPINRQILDLIAEPVEVIGEVERQGDLLILRADPRTIRRVQ